MEEMAQTNQGSSVKQRRKKSTSSQTTQLISSTSKPNKPDLISALPDSLLLRILSCLYMEQVMKTSLLSRRWRYLWKSIPCLCFSYQLIRCQKLDMIHFIDRCLFHHEGSKICKIDISFDYKEDKDALLVDSWIYFAIRRKVEDFTFLLDIYDCYNKFYKLPCSLYLCTELTSLSLRKCIINLPDSFQLGSLKKLSLDFIQLNPDLIERLSSNCPILEDICLRNCNSKMDLNIVIKNEQVKRLEISYYGDEASGNVLKINAPTILSLKISQFDPSIRFNIEELGCLMTAKLDAYGEWFRVSEDVNLIQSRNSLENLLYGLRHVKHLKLCCWCAQVLSIEKPQSSNKFFFSATYLELQSTLEKRELRLISYLLQICPNLLKFKIVIDDHAVQFDEIQYTDEEIEKQDFEEREYWESFETDRTSSMQKLKIIEIDLGSERRIAEFIRYLLKNAKVLERMVIKIPNCGHAEYSLEQLFKFSQKLHTFPRSSPNAKLFIT